MHLTKNGYTERRINLRFCLENGMNFDVFTISALVDEFMDTLVGGRIQDVLDTDPMGIGWEVYANHRRQYVYMSADGQTPRIHRVSARLRRGTERPKQIGLLMRRYLEGGVITHVSQPKWERILQIDVDGPEGEVSVIIEPMERRSNILLVQEGIVLDCMRRVGADENRYRVSLPNHAYQLPPPMTGKLDPFVATENDFVQKWQSNDDPKRKGSQWLSSLVLGVSPLLAKESLFRADVDITALASQIEPQRLWQALQTLLVPLRKREWHTGNAYQYGQAVAFSSYPLTHLADWKASDSMSEALVAFYGAAVGVDAYNEAKKPIEEQIQEARGKLNGKLASLESGLKDQSERNYLQQSGELILAYQYNIKKGQTELKAEYEVDEPPLKIALDPSLTPLENAQRYFDKFNRAKRAQAGVPLLVDDTKLELSYLDQLAFDLEQAANYPEIEEVANALTERGLWQGAPRLKRSSGKTGPLKLTKDGYLIWVGRNSFQNEIVTFKNANPSDLWLHVRGVPGAHGVIRDDGRRIPDTLIANVAAIVAWYSASRAEQKVIVDVTRVKYVRKIKGAGAGMVTYRNEEIVTVSPTNEETLNG